MFQESESTILWEKCYWLSVYEMTRVCFSQNYEKNLFRIWTSNLPIWAKEEKYLYLFLLACWRLFRINKRNQPFRFTKLEFQNQELSIGWVSIFMIISFPRKSNCLFVFFDDKIVYFYQQKLNIFQNKVKKSLIGVNKWNKNMKN